MEKTYTIAFTFSELSSLSYSLTQRIRRLNFILEEAKAVEPHNTILINNLSNTLKNLESTFDKVSSMIVSTM